MRLGSNINVDNVLTDPTCSYLRPAAIFDDERLGQEQKRRILYSWALDADCGRAGDRSCLREAKLALLALDR